MLSQTLLKPIDNPAFLLYNLLCIKLISIPFELGAQLISPKCDLTLHADLAVSAGSPTTICADTSGGMETYMKKIALILLAVILATSLIACNNEKVEEDNNAGVADYAKPVREQDITMTVGSTTTVVGTITYEDGKEGDAATITDYSGVHTDHVIKINDQVGTGEFVRNVTVIGNEAFFFCTAATEIILPSTLVEIGDWAFAGCTGIEEIVIPAGVTSIGKGAFDGCENLKKVTFLGTALVSIDDYAFANCTALEEVAIPEGVETIGSAAFYKCAKITSIKTPASLKEVGDGAFFGCEALNREGALDVSASVNIATKVEKIDGERVETVCLGKHIFGGIDKKYITVPADAECYMAKYVAEMRDIEE